MSLRSQWDRRPAAVFSNRAMGTCLLILSLIGQMSAGSDEPAELSAEQRAAHLERMREIARSMRVYAPFDGRRLPVELVDQPVLRYTDNTRKQYDSTIWVWGAKGRPSAIMAVEFYPQRRDTKWLFEIASLSPARISIERGKQLKWMAREPGLRLEPLADAPRPADKPPARLAQMRQLQQRFAAHERTPVEGRIELRPMARPLHRYQDEALGVLDGAVFAFANGTNPELLWIVEARRDDKDNVGWHFGLAQMTGAEVFAELGGKEIWKCAEADPPAERDTYLNGWLTIDTDGK